MVDGPPFLTDTEDRAWRGLLSLWHLGFPEIERELKKQGLLHIEYGILAVLNMQPDRTLQLGRLAALAGMSPSRLSNRLHQLIERGLVERADSEVDGRAAFARLTARGASLVAEVSPIHFARVRSMIFDRIDESQTETLADALQAIAAGLIDDVWWQAATD